MDIQGLKTPDLSFGNLPPKSWTIAAWATLAALAVVVTYLGALVLGVAFTGFGSIVAFTMLKRLSIGGFVLGLFLLLVGLTVLWSLVSRKALMQPEGAAIDLSCEHQLRTELEAIAGTMAERMPSDVFLVASPNAGVVQLGKRRLMLLGLPLLQLLTVSEFRAVMAHEFAHYYAGDTRLGPWVFRARESMEQVLRSLTGESVLLEITRKWGVVALLHMLIVGAVELYWKLLTRFTQSISRRQEFRCDELACYIAGSTSLEGGLCSLQRAASGFSAYWHHVSSALVTGFRPQVADGFGRFMAVPAIAAATAAYTEQQVANEKTGIFDSHPPLGARLRKLRALAIPVPREDSRPAIALIQDLPKLELALLQNMAPNLNVAALKVIDWNSAGLAVYAPWWRRETEKLRQLLGPCSLAKLPEKVRGLRDIAHRLPDARGTLPTREQRLEKATELLSLVLTLALLDRGWRLHFQPGEHYLEMGTEKLQPRATIAELTSGQLSATQWEEYCGRLGMMEWALVEGSPNDTGAAGGVR